MFLFFSLIFCSNIADNVDFIPWRGWTNQQEKIEVDQIKNSSILYQILRSAKTSGCKRGRPFHYKKNSSTISNNHPQEVSFDEVVLSFIKLMKNVYLKPVNSTLEKTFHSDVKNFKDQIDQWKNDKMNVKEPIFKCKFPSQLDYIFYKSNYYVTNQWIRVFKDILNIDLPSIGTKILNSTIHEDSKKSIIESVDQIVEAMDYFYAFAPKHLHYNYHKNSLKHRFQLLITRFPYLFNEFNLCGRLINLYESIIENYIKKVDDSYDMKIALTNMSINLQKMFSNYDRFLNAIRRKLRLLEKLKMIN
ncbi:uncharacterized protein VNE69_07118 [Vairimorpha necatrix]|uniref:Uncharacterized protein n=1 Tax=Vairimorpha necatrix TaxID=6039 RepID=A0AAX4JDJ2_9MICR